MRVRTPSRAVWRIWFDVRSFPRDGGDGVVEIEHLLKGEVRAGVTVGPRGREQRPAAAVSSANKASRASRLMVPAAGLAEFW